MSTALRIHMNVLIAGGTEFQVQLRGLPSPIGPGIVENLVVTGTVGGISKSLDLCRMSQIGMMQTNPQSRPVKVKLPYVFDPDDVLMIIEAPVNADGDKLVTTPGSGGSTRTAGGIHILGDS